MNTTPTQHRQKHMLSMCALLTLCAVFLSVPAAPAFAQPRSDSPRAQQRDTEDRGERERQGRRAAQSPENMLPMLRERLDASKREQELLEQAIAAAEAGDSPREELRELGRLMRERMETPRGMLGPARDGAREGNRKGPEGNLGHEQEGLDLPQSQAPVDTEQAAQLREELAELSNDELLDRVRAERPEAAQRMDTLRERNPEMFTRAMEQHRSRLEDLLVRTTFGDGEQLAPQGPDAGPNAGRTRPGKGRFEELREHMAAMRQAHEANDEAALQEARAGARQTIETLFDLRQQHAQEMIAGLESRVFELRERVADAQANRELRIEEELDLLQDRATRSKGSRQGQGKEKGSRKNKGEARSKPDA